MPLTERLEIKSALGPCEVRFEASLDFWARLVRDEKTVFVVDRKVIELTGELASPPSNRTIALDANESVKSLDGAAGLYADLIRTGVRRSWTLVSLGGGVVQDVAGFVASTFHRGLRWVHVPTTLLAQADSCIGGKTGLNFGPPTDVKKNLIGTFHAPRVIHLWPGFLKTLSETDHFSGLGEIAKLHFLQGGAGRSWLEQHLEALRERSEPVLSTAIRRSLAIKKEFIEEDEFDAGRRRILNYGHCFGHALEAASGFALPHGLAVVAGMIFANIVSEQRGWMKPADRRAIERELLRPVLWASTRPERLSIKPEWLDAEKLLGALSEDKKREGAGLPMILARQDAGGVEWVQAQDLTRDEFLSALGCFPLN